MANTVITKKRSHAQSKISLTNHPINLAFSIFAKKIADIVGNAWMFVIAFLIILVWGMSGHYFNYSNTWQLVINTGTTIITFLVVFLIQNTQNRDTEILNLKLDELIRAKKGAKNSVIHLTELSDIELKQLEKEYIKLKNKRTGI
jgi:low affinity Fe/Cu permease